MLHRLRKLSLFDKAGMHYGGNRDGDTWWHESTGLCGGESELRIFPLQRNG